MRNYTKEIETFKSSFEKKYCNDFGYNYNYNIVNKDLNIKVPTLSYIAYNFVDLFYKELSSYLKEKYQDDFGFLLLTEEQKNRILNISKKVNKCDLKSNWKLFFFDIVKEELDYYLEAISINFNSGEILLDTSPINIEDDYISEMKLEKEYPTFDDLVGLDNAKKVIKERILEPTKHKDIYEKYNIKVGGGVLLYGLPGTGKTMFAQAVANEVNGRFFAIKSSDIKSKYFGETENKIKNIFETARKYPVSIIFFDEFEAIGVSRDKLGSELTASSVVPELLSQMQGFEQKDNIILVIAATNRPWDIDSALLRPGRLDYLIEVELPNTECRKIMLQKKLDKIILEDDILEYLVNVTNNYNGADISNISDKLLRIVVDKEIKGVKDYIITFEDCVEVLKENKTSVSSVDVTKMKMFTQNNNNNF